MNREGRHGRAVGGVLLVGALILALCVPGRLALGAATRADADTVTVDAGHVIARVPSTAIGVNTAVWDPYLRNRAVLPLLRQVHTEMIRYPGGSTADVYHWRSNNTVDGTNVIGADSFDGFMQHVVKPIGAQAIITVNYGTNRDGSGPGDPREAAAWVRYANRTRHYGVKYWEIGNEIYGNGYYGAHWEDDQHHDHSPKAYARTALAFIRAMKAQDRSISAGLVLTLPGVWPDGQGPEDWNATVLKGACRAADFAAVHWYPQNPGKESDQGLLDSVSAVPDMVSRLRSVLGQYCGSHAAHMQIMLTETNSVSSDPGKQSTSVINGLFLIEDYLSWLQAGIQNVSWWDLHNDALLGNNNSPDLAGTTDYGDYGLLSRGDAHEPPVNTPMTSYRGLQLMTRALVPGSSFVQSTSAVGPIRIFALKQPGGRLSLVLVNTSASETHTLNISVTGLGAVGSASVSTFGLASPKTTTGSLAVQGGRLSYSIPPYSAAVLQLSP